MKFYQIDFLFQTSQPEGAKSWDAYNMAKDEKKREHTLFDAYANEEDNMKETSTEKKPVKVKHNLTR